MFGLSGKVVAALLSVYLFWGGTYLAARFALESMPPLVVTCLRHFLAGILLYAAEWKRGLAPAGWREWRDAAVAGTLLLALGNGMMVTGQQYIPSGLAATIPGTVPMWIVLIYWFWKKDAKPNIATIAGLVIGFAGVALLAQNAATVHSSTYFFGVCIVIAAAFFWSLGSVYSKMSVQPKNPLQWASMQMICGGAVLFIGALISGQLGRLDISAVSARSWAGILYLIFFGSCLGYASYVWLLNNASPSLASTFAYVNPLVAVFLGWLIAGEVLGEREIVAAAIIISAVVLVTMGNNKDAANAGKRK